ncbi:unnamed protein product [Toxocara canis]|uniref:Secreted protein n=1 Tax=Toxocara canis TaxID=6265 RepID=A0A183UF25_TOXCA|nr:unnamed protein product [Toxocara canis]
MVVVELMVVMVMAMVVAEVVDGDGGGGGGCDGGGCDGSGGCGGGGGCDGGCNSSLLVLPPKRSLSLESNKPIIALAALLGATCAPQLFVSYQLMIRFGGL